MAKTFIYGVPHGFDFYEKDAEFNDYFKGFYISSRRGRRLMINRRDNGETIYSYLRYGLKEVDRQPLHSFFGMSLVIDNYQFCPNFKVLLEWFDYLFNKLVNEHNIIKFNDDGVLYYVIHKFDENSFDVEWLKSNLPNILTQAGQTEIVSYDTSFADGKAGQVVSFNKPVGESRLLNTFKKYRWISVSSEIVEKEDNVGIVTDFGTIELNYEELNRKLNEFNQQLLPIAVDISKGSYADLKRMSEEVIEINSSLVKYLPTIDDLEEKEKFGGLESKYDSLKDSIGTLMSKMVPTIDPISVVEPRQQTQFCFSCKQNKPLSNFRSSDATKCLECEERDRLKKVTGTNVPKGYKICISCGNKKPVRCFNQKGTDICDDCAKAQLSKPPVSSSSFEKFGKILMSKGFLGTLVSIAIVAGVAFAAISLPNHCSSTNVRGEGGEVTDTTITNEVIIGDVVDRQELDNLVENGNFKAVYEYIKDKKDAANYISSLKNIVNRHLWSIVDSSNTAKDDLAEFYIVNNDFLDYIGFSEEDKSAWDVIVDDYVELWSILKKNKVSEADLKKGNEILAKHSNLFPPSWNQVLSEKPKETVKKKEDTPVTKVGTTFKLTYTKASDGKTTTIDIKASKGVDVKMGTSAIVSCNNGTIKEFGKQSCTVIVKESRPYTIKCTDAIVITLTPKGLDFSQ